MPEKYLNELLKNETFINYCLRRNEQDVSDWENRIKEHPETKAKLEELKAIVLSIGHHAGQKAIEQNYLKLRALINQGYEMKKRYILFLFSWISSAAAIIILPMLIFFYGLTDESIKDRINAARFLDSCCVKNTKLHNPADHPENSLIYSVKYRPDDYASMNQIHAIK
ncbi:hypothetical protein AY601_2231 [Pedobacter cryoconitis]|uniref:Uncharacterized protein n=1 Tax=Pedobacter cryoconitis TaxID=188932 RepID=A0A127VD39_9SPHI|nr:hypothetical protein [Pedobacter cryoconitis]AMP99127.1 hypothetical protein AY601_2231 [Pedobacter cryoconitis]